MFLQSYPKWSFSLSYMNVNENHLVPESLKHAPSGDTRTQRVNIGVD